MMYLIPWIDTIHIGREIYHRFPITVIIDRLPGECRRPRSPSVGPRLLALQTLRKLASSACAYPELHPALQQYHEPASTRPSSCAVAC